MKLRLSESGDVWGGFRIQKGQLLEEESSQRRNMKVWRISDQELAKRSVKLFDVNLILQSRVLDGDFEHEAMFDGREFWAWGHVPKEAVVDSTNYTAIKQEKIRELGFEEAIPQAAGIRVSGQGFRKMHTRVLKV